jgi:magnesium transporter
MGGHVHYIELDQFVGPRYLVTVHGPVNPVVKPDIPLRETRTVLKRIEAGRLRPSSSFELSHAIVCTLANARRPSWRLLPARSGRLSNGSRADTWATPGEFLEELFRTRHALLAVSNIARLGHLIYGRMVALTRFLPAEASALVADMVDQFDRIRSLADGEREYLEGVIEFYRIRTETKRAIAAERQNEDVRKISAWAAVIAVPTLISSIYGMNFERMPELSVTFGYPVAVAVMLAVSLAIYSLFRRSGWL